MDGSEPTSNDNPVTYKEAFQAAKEGNSDKLLTMIAADENVLNIADSNQSTPLTVAFAYGKLELARLLIERGANLFAMNHSSKWGMRYIVQYEGLAPDQREKLTEAAIAAGASDIEIFHAVWRRDQKRAAEILKLDPPQVSRRLADPDGGSGYYNGLPYCGLSPLHYAVIAGDKSMVQLLLEAGAEVDAVPHGRPADSRYTPMYCTPEGCGDVAQLLVDHGANVKHTSLYLTGGSKAMQQVVVANGAIESALIGALTSGDLEKAIQIAQTDPSVIHERLPDARVDTPLHMAVKKNCPEVVKLLVGHGMDVDTLSSRGFTSLAMASEMYSSFKMFKLLVELGADVHAGNDSSLRGAIWQHAFGHWNYENVIKYLVEKGSKPRGFFNCAMGGNLAFAKLMIELGADVNETDEIGFYEKRLPNREGHTALDYCTGIAGEHKHPEIAALLLEHGAKHKSELDSR